MGCIEDWEELALEKHKQIEEAFLSGKSGIKSAQLEDESIRMRIANHLLETGGGLTADEIAADAKATEGKEWRNASADGSPVVIREVLKDMLAPGSNMKRMLEAAGGFGIVDYSLAQEMNKQYVLKEKDGRYFLWCQDGIDWGAKLSMAKSKLEAAQKDAGQVDALKERAKSIQSQIDALQKELRQLGFLKFSEKKRLKMELNNEENVLSAITSKISRAESASNAIPRLMQDYEQARAECKKMMAS